MLRRVNTNALYNYHYKPVLAEVPAVQGDSEPCNCGRYEHKGCVALALAIWGGIAGAMELVVTNVIGP